MKKNTKVNAAILIIGNEILSGRTQDTNTGTLAVLKTQPAFASVLAHRIDSGEIPGVLGTIAGDDTVFAALFDRAVYPLLCDFLGYSEQP